MRPQLFHDRSPKPHTREIHSRKAGQEAKGEVATATDSLRSRIRNKD